MSIKTTGYEFNKFYEDPKIWTEGTYHDDTLIFENGQEVDDLLEIANDSIIKIETGSIFPEGNYEKRKDLLAVFRKWKKSQGVTYLLVKVENSKLDQVTTQIKNSGGQIVK